SRDGGSTFAPAVVASLPARAATFPVLAAGGGRVTIAWSEDTAFAAAEAEHKMGHDDKTMHMPLPAVGNKSIVLRDGRISMAVTASTERRRRYCADDTAPTILRPTLSADR